MIYGGLYVTENLRKEHFNLYYIFKEDKEQNQLQKREALILWENIINILQKNNKIQN